MALVHRAIAWLLARDLWHGLAADLGLADLDPTAPTELLPLPAATAVQWRAAQLSGDALFGLSLVLTTTPSDYGIPGQVFAHHDTLGEAIAQALDVMLALNPTLAFTVDTLPDGARRLALGVGVHDPGQQQVAQEVLGAIVHLGRAVTGVAWSPRRLRVPPPTLPVIAATQRAVHAALGVEIELDGDTVELVVEPSDLALPIPDADPIVLTHMREAVATQASKRMHGRAVATVLVIGDIVINVDEGAVVRQGTRTRLTPREAQVLRVLAARRNEVVTQADLEAALFGDTRRAPMYAVSIAVRRLRRKIEPDPAHPMALLTLFGEGWILRVPDADEDPPG